MKNSRIFGLDLLRAIAIILVLIIHGNLILLPLIPENERYMLYRFLVDGVDIFFVLSGFLIGKIIFKIFVETNDRISFNTLKTFWLRRWFRTLPLYYTLLFFLYLYYVYYLKYEIISLKVLLRFVFFVQNFKTLHPKFYEEAWSLAVEEWFYILFPISIFVLNRLFGLKINRKSILLIISIFIVLPFLIRVNKLYILGQINYEMYDSYIRKLVVTRLDAIMYGVLVAYVYSYKKTMWLHLSSYKYLILGLFFVYFNNINTIFNLVVFDNPFLAKSTFITPLFCLGVCFMIPFLTTVKYGDNIFSKFIFHTSKISYSLYLVHSTITIWIVINNIPVVVGNIFGDVLLRYILYFIVSYSIASLTYYFIELPFLNFRDKYFR